MKANVAVVKRGGARPGAGRPFYKATDEEREVVAILRANGYDIHSIARILKLAPDTLKRHYGDALEAGHELITAKIRVVLAKAALGGNISAAVRWLIMRGGWVHPKGTLGDPNGFDEQTEVVHFYLPPNHRNELEPPIDTSTPLHPDVLARITDDTQTSRTSRPAPDPVLKSWAAL